jgi:adenylate kinase family enzyme
MQRVLVVGMSGAGKTTAARRRTVRFTAQREFEHWYELL